MRRRLTSTNCEATLPHLVKILIACEFSGVVRDAFAARGHEACSCDLRPCLRPGWHIQGDCRAAIALQSWDMLIAHPPCTYLNSAGLHWNRRGRGTSKTEAALEFVRELLAADVPKIALENPVGCISTRIRPADQYVQPYEFGDDASKKTGLWLKGLPRLVSTAYFVPRIVDGRPRWSNQTDSGQNRLGPSLLREAMRSVTYPGIAAAMAAQWG